MSKKRTPEPQERQQHEPPGPPRPLALALARYGTEVSAATRRLIRVELGVWCNGNGMALVEVFEAQTDAQEVHELQSLRDYLDRLGAVGAVVLYGRVHQVRIEHLAERYDGLEVLPYQAATQLYPQRELPPGVVVLPALAEEFRQRRGSRPASRASRRRG